MLPKSKYQVVIVGAGAAGMAAAIKVSKLGLSVAVLDQGRSPGGLIYHNLENSPFHTKKELLGPDYFKGEKLILEFRKSSVDYLSNTTVWQVSPDDLEIGYTYEGKSFLVEAERVLLAIGGQERPFPIDGGTLPGVMTVGAAQLLMKSSQLVAENAVIAGNGPLILLLAWQYVNAGIPIKGILSTNSPLNYIKALPHMPKALRASHYLLKGGKLIASLMSKGVRFYTGVSTFKALGYKSVEGVSFVQYGNMKKISTDCLLVHQGVIPEINLSSAIGLKHYYHKHQLCWVPKVGTYGETSHKDIFMAGDITHVSGAIAAEQKGYLAALKIAESLGVISSSELKRFSFSYLQQLNVELSVRPFLDILYAPSKKNLLPASEDTIVCRCEEVKAKEIRAAIKDFKARDHNEIKDFTRASMGHCQGRQCGHVISEMLLDIRKISSENLGHIRGRFPTVPISINQFSNLKIPDHKISKSGELLK